MNSDLLVLLAFGSGIFIGVLTTIITWKIMQSGKRAAEVVNPTLPDGIEQVLVAIDSAGIVLDGSNNVQRISPMAATLGLIKDNRLMNTQIQKMVTKARMSGQPVIDQIDLQSGLFQETLHLAVRVSPLGPRYLLVLLRDQTETTRLDEVRRDFLANVSHELKTPIGAVRLLAEALESAQASPSDVKRFAIQLTKEADRLSRITQEMIELSRLQAANSPTSSSLVSVEQVIAAAIDANKVAAETKHIDLAVGGAGGLQVWGEASQLTTAIHNLIANAITYSPDRSRIGIGVKLDGDMVEIVVTDQGIGIPAEDIARVFERFYRVDEARARHTGGTGLGLSIVKHIVRVHGGDVRVWSQANLGSSFTIRLPEGTKMLNEVGEK